MSHAFQKFDLTGKTALVTGGTQGIGLDISRALAHSGAKVMLAARREELLKSAASELMQDPDISTEVLWHSVDLNDRDSVAALSKHALSTLGGVDIFVGNAGMERQERIENISDTALDEQIRVNLTANIELTRDLLPHMKKQQWGRFIYCSSAASTAGSANDQMSVYGSVKSGINGFTKYVAAEAGHDNITANSLILGIYMTEMVKGHLDSLSEEARDEYLQGVPSSTSLGRAAETGEIMGTIQLLASDAGSYITGACLAIDGGMTATLRPNPVVAENLVKHAKR